MSDYPKYDIKVPRFNEANGFYTTKQRSGIMGRIKSTGTNPEKKLCKFLWNLGIRYRKNVKKLPGKPDIVISKYKLIIFIDGEFWHGYKWMEKKGKIKSNREFWIPKIERNIQRDITNNKLLSQKGWHVMRFWGQQVKQEFNVCINKILTYIEGFEMNL